MGIAAATSLRRALLSPTVGTATRSAQKYSVALMGKYGDSSKLRLTTVRTATNSFPRRKTKRRTRRARARPSAKRKTKRRTKRKTKRRSSAKRKTKRKGHRTPPAAHRQTVDFHVLSFGDLCAS